MNNNKHSFDLVIALAATNVNWNTIHKWIDFDDLLICTGAELLASQPAYVVTIDKYIGRARKRNIIKINKNSIDLHFPEYRTKKARFFYRPTINKYVNDYSGESFNGTDVHL